MHCVIFVIMAVNVQGHFDGRMAKYVADGSDGGLQADQQRGAGVTGAATVLIAVVAVLLPAGKRAIASAHASTGTQSQR